MYKNRDDREKPSWKSARLPGFAEWLTYIGEVRGWSEETVAKLYGQNLEEQRMTLAEGDLVSRVLIDKINKVGSWAGTMSNLLFALTDHAKNKMNMPNIDSKNNKAWPTTASWLGRRINEAKANLNKLGIEVREIRVEGFIERRYEIINPVVAEVVAEKKRVEDIRRRASRGDVICPFLFTLGTDFRSRKECRTCFKEFNDNYRNCSALYKIRNPAQLAEDRKVLASTSGTRIVGIATNTPISFTRSAMKRDPRPKLKRRRID